MRRSTSRKRWERYQRGEGSPNGSFGKVMKGDIRTVEGGLSSFINVD